jgi:hypothetical protein
LLTNSAGGDTTSSSLAGLVSVVLAVSSGIIIRERSRGSIYL